MNKKIVVVGSSNTDMIIKVNKIPRPGETVLGGRFSTAAGGKGANQAVAAARAGGDVTFVARVGKDVLGEEAIRGFIKSGIDVTHVVKDPDAPSGVALIFVAEDGENSIAVASGANANLSPADVENAAESIKNADILVMQLESPIETVAAAAQVANDNGVTVILNPAPAQPLSENLLRMVSLLTPNESEAELLTGVTVKDDDTASEAAKALLAKGVESVIITLGPRGALVGSRDSFEFVSGYKVTAVDSTAAGDVFNGALAVGLAEGRSLHDAVLFANAAAALSVTKLGAQPSTPSRREIYDFIG
jgi:ribokinase